MSYVGAHAHAIVRELMAKFREALILPTLFPLCIAKNSLRKS